jgi:hypothetical protein
MQKILCLFALLLGLSGCGGGGSSTPAAAPRPPGAPDAATAALGSALVPPPLHPVFELESELIPDAAASVADSFPAELNPPGS